MDMGAVLTRILVVEVAERERMEVLARPDPERPGHLCLGVRVQGSLTGFGVLLGEGAAGIPEIPLGPLGGVLDTSEATGDVVIWPGIDWEPDLAEDH